VQTSTRRQSHDGLTGAVRTLLSGFSKLSRLIASSLAPAADLTGSVAASLFGPSDPNRNNGAGRARRNLGCEVDGDFPTAKAPLSRTSIVVELAMVWHFGQGTVKEPDGAFDSSTRKRQLQFWQVIIISVY